MKILSLMPYSPVPPTFGGALRMYHLLKWMARHHEVTLLTYGKKGEVLTMDQAFPTMAGRTHMIPQPLFWLDRWKRLGQAYAILRNTSYTQVSSQSADMQRALDRLFDAIDFDMVKIFFPLMGFFRFRTDAIRVLDAANVEYDIHRRVAHHTKSRTRKWWSTFEYKKFYPQEIAICKEQDAILLTSERDRTLLHKDVPEKPKFVIPNGVDSEYFHVSTGSPESNTLVFTGAINYLPNADGVEDFITQILPLVLKEVPDLKFYVVGNAPPESIRRLASDHVIVTGFVPDVRPYVEQASVYVVPLRMGGGTRLKVLEAMAMERPIVTTSIGCEGIDAVNEESVLIGDDPPAFAQQILRLLRDKMLRRKLVTNGYELIRTSYEWSAIGKQLEKAYAQIVDTHAATRKKTS